MSPTAACRIDVLRAVQKYEDIRMQQAIEEAEMGQEVRLMDDGGSAHASSCMSWQTLSIPLSGTLLRPAMLILATSWGIAKTVSSRAEW